MSSTSTNMALVLPDVNDDVTDTIADLTSNFNAIDKFWPIGSIFISTSSTSPATSMGFGTWSQIQGRFLLGCSSGYPAGSTGGAATHKHYKADTGGSLQNTDQAAGSWVVSNTNNVKEASSLPPYLSVYMWERTA